MKINTKKISKKILFLFLSAIIATLFLTSTSVALTSGSFSASPAENGKTWFIYNLAPGESVTDKVLIENSQNVTQTFYIYPADLAKNSDGGFAIKQRTEEMNDIGSWIELGRSEITLAPKSSKLIEFKLTVPNDSKLDIGEHAGGIAIEEKAGTTQAIQKGIVMHKRIGVRVYVTLPGDIIKNIKYESFTKRISDFRSFIIPRKYQFSVALENIGNVSNTVELTLHSKNLISRKTETQKFNQLLTRETKGISNFNWEAPFIGIYNFKVEGVYETLDGTETFTTKKLIGIIIPWDLVILILAICVLARQAFNKYKKQYSGEGWTKYAVKKQDTLDSLSKKHAVTWKQIAKVNKLKAPYTLKENQKILLPKKSISRK